MGRHPFMWIFWIKNMIQETEAISGRFLPVFDEFLKPCKITQKTSKNGFCPPDRIFYSKILHE